MTSSMCPARVCAAPRGQGWWGGGSPGAQGVCLGHSPARRALQLSQSGGQTPARASRTQPGAAMPSAADTPASRTWSDSRTLTSSDQAQQDLGLLQRLQSLSLSLTKDPEEKPAKPVCRRKSKAPPLCPWNLRVPLVLPAAQTHGWISGNRPSTRGKPQPSPSWCQVRAQRAGTGGTCPWRLSEPQGAAGEAPLGRSFDKLRLCPSNLQRLWSVPQGAAPAPSSAIWVSVGVMGPLGRTLPFEVGFISCFSKF